MISERVCDPTQRQHRLANPSTGNFAASERRARDTTLRTIPPGAKHKFFPSEAKSDRHFFAGRLAPSQTVQSPSYSQQFDCIPKTSFEQCSSLLAENSHHSRPSAADQHHKSRLLSQHRAAASHDKRHAAKIASGRYPKEPQSKPHHHQGFKARQAELHDRKQVNSSLAPAPMSSSQAFQPDGLAANGYLLAPQTGTAGDSRLFTSVVNCEAPLGTGPTPRAYSPLSDDSNGRLERSSQKWEDEEEKPKTDILKEACESIDINIECIEVEDEPMPCQLREIAPADQGQEAVPYAPIEDGVTTVLSQGVPLKYKDTCAQVPQEVFPKQQEHLFPEHSAPPLSQNEDHDDGVRFAMNATEK